MSITLGTAVVFQKQQGRVVGISAPKYWRVRFKSGDESDIHEALLQLPSTIPSTTSSSSEVLTLSEFYQCVTQEQVQNKLLQEDVLSELGADDSQVFAWMRRASRPTPQQLKILTRILEPSKRHVSDIAQKPSPVTDTGTDALKWVRTLQVNGMDYTVEITAPSDQSVFKAVCVEQDQITDTGSSLSGVVISIKNKLIQSEGVGAQEPSASVGLLGAVVDEGKSRKSPPLDQEALHMKDAPTVYLWDRIQQLIK